MIARCLYCELWARRLPSKKGRSWNSSCRTGYTAITRHAIITTHHSIRILITICTAQSLFNTASSRSAVRVPGLDTLQYPTGDWGTWHSLLCQSGGIPETSCHRHRIGTGGCQGVISVFEDQRTGTAKV